MSQTVFDLEVLRTFVTGVRLGSLPRPPTGWAVPARR
jgi:hypothetical protein